MKITPLDQGIEEILWHEVGKREVEIPSSIIPGDIPPENLLDELLRAPGLTERLTNSLSPQITHREILQPATFQTLTYHLPDRLREAAREADSSHTKRVLLEAADVFEEQRQHMEILNAYRKLLIKG